MAAFIKTPACLHIPELYESETATLMWEPVEGAAAYEKEPIV